MPPSAWPNIQRSKIIEHEVHDAEPDTEFDEDLISQMIQQQMTEQDKNVWAYFVAIKFVY